MQLLRQHRRLWLATAALGAAGLASSAAEPPIKPEQMPVPPPAPLTDPNVQPAQAGVVQPSQPPSLTQPGTGGTSLSEALGLPQAQSQGFAPPAATNLGTTNAPRLASETVAPTGASVPVGSQASPVLNAPDLGELLSKSAAASGVEVQRRNAIVSDPRIRGYRVGEVVTLGDGALFIPARQDLDTAVAKFDPGSVRDIIVVKGPYSVQYGPGFAFLDIVTLDSPRYQNGFEMHGRTSVGYQTNGARWDGLQSIFAGDQDWGFRATWNILSGNDYQAGYGPDPVFGTRPDVAASYNSNNVNFALGGDLTPNSKIEFKGLRVHQHELEFPGLYFDIHQLDTEAYSLRYTLERQQYFDRLTLDTWYNTTVADGNTQQGAKQAFVQKLLSVSFNNPPPVGAAPFAFEDFSTTRFSDKSLGYRLAVSWGDTKGPTLTAGSDYNLFGQTLIENIRLLQTSGPPLNNTVTGITQPPFPPAGQPSPAGPVYTQNQSIPTSSASDPGIFLETTLPLSDRLNVKAGGRFDYVHTTSDSRLITGNINLFGTPQQIGLGPDPFTLDPIIYSTDPTRTNLDRDFPLFAAFLSSEYKVDEHVTALTAMGYSERAPTLTELYAAGPFIGVLQQGTSRLIGDPNLEKPKLAQFDVGLQADYGWIRGGVTGFYAFVHDYITFDLNKGGPGITQVVFTNTDLATLAGGELFGQMDLTAWLTPFGNLAYVQGTDRTHRDNRRPAGIASSRRDDLVTNERATDSEPLAQIPPLEMRTGVRIHPPTTNRRWQVEISARTIMGQNNVATSLQELPTPGFTVFDVRSYWQVKDWWLLTAGVENFGDKLYREHLDPISGNVLGVDPLFRPGTNFYFASQMTY
jgi:outer membrane receptor protein involved in Fe transport